MLTVLRGISASSSAAPSRGSQAATPVAAPAAAQAAAQATALASAFSGPAGVAALAAMLVLAALLFWPGPALGAEKDGSLPADIPGYSLEDMRQFTDDLYPSTGRDQVPPIYRPAFVRVSDASLSMDNREPVFLIHFPGGLTRVYPQSIMVWHETVNDVLPADYSLSAQSTGQSAGQTAGQSQAAYRSSYQTGRRAESSGNSYTLSYSPLSGSVVAFRSMAGRFPAMFGNEGKLLNGNSVLYDRTTNSLWSQLLAVCIDGPLRGKRLERIPVYWARWGGVKERYPDAEVLSRTTGHRRPYGRDPYGSYFSSGNYYDDARILFPLSNRGDQLPPKERILGLEIGSIYGALIVGAVREARVVNQTLGVTRLVAFYDEQLDSIRVFESKLPDGTVLNFHWFENKFMDRNTKSEWNPDGTCIYGRLRNRSLKPVLAVDSMWFAWYAFHPDTRVLGKELVKVTPRPDIPY